MFMLNLKVPGRNDRTLLAISFTGPSMIELSYHDVANPDRPAESLKIDLARGAEQISDTFASVLTLPVLGGLCLLVLSSGCPPGMSEDDWKTLQLASNLGVIQKSIRMDHSII